MSFLALLGMSRFVFKYFYPPPLTSHFEHSHLVITLILLNTMIGKLKFELSKLPLVQRGATLTHAHLESSTIGISVAMSYGRDIHVLLKQQPRSNTCAH